MAIGRRPVQPRVRRRERRHRARLEVHHLVLAGPGVLAGAADVVVLRRRRLAGRARAGLHVDVATHGVVPFGLMPLVARRFRTAKPTCALRVFRLSQRASWSPGLSCPGSVFRPVLARAPDSDGCGPCRHQDARIGSPRSRRGASRLRPRTGVRRRPDEPGGDLPDQRDARPRQRPGAGRWTMTTRAAGTPDDHRPLPGAAVRAGVSVEWEVRETAGRRGRRSAGAPPPARRARLRHHPAARTRARQWAGQLFRHALRFVAGRVRAPGQQLRQTASPFSTCCSRSSLSERWAAPCSSQPLIRRLN